MKINALWNRLSSVQKVVVSLIGLNIAVFIAWRLKHYSTLTKYFVLDYTSRKDMNGFIISIFHLIIECFSTS